MRPSSARSLSLLLLPAVIIAASVELPTAAATPPTGYVNDIKGIYGSYTGGTGDCGSTPTNGNEWDTDNATYIQCYATAPTQAGACTDATASGPLVVKWTFTTARNVSAIYGLLAPVTGISNYANVCYQIFVTKPDTTTASFGSVNPGWTGSGSASVTFNYVLGYNVTEVRIAIGTVGSPSGWGGARILDIEAVGPNPAQPEFSIAATASTCTITVTQDALSATGYSVFRTTPAWSPVATPMNTSAFTYVGHFEKGSTYADAGRTNGVLYHYRLAPSISASEGGATTVGQDTQCFPRNPTSNTLTTPPTYANFGPSGIATSQTPSGGCSTAVFGNCMTDADITTTYSSMTDTTTATYLGANICPGTANAEGFTADWTTAKYVSQVTAKWRYPFPNGANAMCVDVSLWNGSTLVKDVTQYRFAAQSTAYTYDSGAFTAVAATKMRISMAQQCCGGWNGVDIYDMAIKYDPANVPDRPPAPTLRFAGGWASNGALGMVAADATTSTINMFTSSTSKTLVTGTLANETYTYAGSCAYTGVTLYNCTITGLTPSVTYYLRTSASNAGGESNASGEMSFIAGKTDAIRGQPIYLEKSAGTGTGLDSTWLWRDVVTTFGDNAVISNTQSENSGYCGSATAPGDTSKGNQSIYFTKTDATNPKTSPFTNKESRILDNLHIVADIPSSGSTTACGYLFGINGATGGGTWVETETFLGKCGKIGGGNAANGNTQQNCDLTFTSASYEGIRLYVQSGYTSWAPVGNINELYGSGQWVGTPGPPTSFTATAGAHKIDLAWTAPAQGSPTSYSVFRSTTTQTPSGAMNASYTYLTTIGTNTSYSDQTLAGGVTRYYRVVGSNSLGEGTASSEATATTTYIASNAPTALSATGSDRQISLTWTAPTTGDVTGYVIYRGGTQLAAIGTNTTFIDQTAVNGQTYTYKIAGYAPAAFGTNSTTASDTAHDNVAPAAATSFTGTQGQSATTTLTWTLPADTDLASQQLYRDASLLATLTAINTSFTDAQVANDHTYAYTLKATDTSANQGPAASASVTTLDTIAPAQVTGLILTPSDRVITLTWTASGANDLAHYKIYRAGTLLATSGTNTTFDDRQVMNGIAYTYTVAAQDATGNIGTQSTSATATPIDNAGPAAPTSFSGTQGQSATTTLTWTNPTDYDFASLQLYRDSVLLSTLSTSNVSFVDAQLQNDRTYAYTLKATDTSANQGPAASATVTTLDTTPPPQVNGLSLTTSDRDITLTWTASAAGDLAHYKIYRGGTFFATIGTNTTFDDHQVTNGIAYTYTVAAQDVTGNIGAQSAAATATPSDNAAPAAPTALTAASGQNHKSDLAWTNPADYDLATLQIYRDASLIATLNAPAQAYSDTSALNDHTYSYTIRARDTSGNLGTASTAASATTLDTIPPTSATSFTATGHDVHIDLAWSYAFTSDGATWKIYRDTVLLATIPYTNQSFTDAQVTNGATHAYNVASVDQTGNEGAASNTATTSAIDDVAPAAAPGLTATRADTLVTLSWTAVTDRDEIVYQVQRDGASLATQANRTWLDRAVTNDVTYTYRVRAQDPAGNVGPWSTNASATPTDLTPPAAPNGLIGTPGDRVVSLAWNANTESDLDHYRIYRAGTALGTSRTNTFSDTGLQNGQIVAYNVTAIDTHGNEGPNSTGVLVTPRDLVGPAAPTSLHMTRSGTAYAQTAWDASPEYDFASWTIYLDGAQRTTITSSSYNVTSLVNGVHHQLQVHGVDTSGNSGSNASLDVYATDDTPPAPVTSQTATGHDNAVALHWTNPTDSDFAGVRITRGSTILANVLAPITDYYVTGLQNGVSYTFTFNSYDTSMNLGAARSATATPVDDHAPDAPEIYFSEAFDAKTHIEWHALDDVVTYTVLRDGIQIAQGIDGREYYDATPENGVTYTYCILAKDTAGNNGATSCTQLTPEGKGFMAQNAARMRDGVVNAYASYGPLIIMLFSLMAALAGVGIYVVKK